MKFSLAIAVASVAAGVQAQGAPTGMVPAGGSPPGCLATGTGKYEVMNVKISAKRSLERRAVDCSNPDALIVQLNNGILTDSKGRIGSIVANRQFQFDGPPAQTGAIYTGGWSICANESLAIGPTTVFYQCLSGGFYNIYDQPQRNDCVEIHQQLLQCADSTTGSSSATSASTSAPVTTSATAVSQQSDGQPTASSATTVVSQQTDGQPTAASATSVVTQITDGQPQATSPSNATRTGSPPVVTGGAAQFVASGAVVALGAAAAFFL